MECLFLFFARSRYATPAWIAPWVAVVGTCRQPRLFRSSGHGARGSVVQAAVLAVTGEEIIRWDATGRCEVGDLCLLQRHGGGEQAGLDPVPEINGFSAGGMPTRVKCLHALAGHALAVGPGVNPFGDEVVAELGEFWCSPCTPAHREPESDRRTA